ncbi:MAG TPA: hypothetical protein VHN15_12225 [Thermoanaerobaculia bacterium]|nr:hypothetical protein [Thermoanaerobaculia bacterium]
MFNMAKQRVFVALFVMGFLLLGAMAAEARGRRDDTNGADRLVKGAVIGAAVGTGVQVLRDRKEGKELLKGAAVGAAAGAAVGAYGDYRQERDARVDAERDRYRGRGYRDRDYRGSRYDRYDDRYDDSYYGRRDVRHRHSKHCDH